MNVVDSSGWIEYFFGRPNAAFFRPAICDTSNLIVPAIAVYEVARYIGRVAGRDAAQEAAAQMQRARIAELDAVLALAAARAGLKYNLPLPDSIVFATAQWHSAKLYTQDADFEKIPGVKYVRKNG
ncbi:MAG TPA: type II toxin-antitoxin system VapC family toxin [Bryobacteraceae bacterium]|jgi:predicted nucleic acid-binding protein